LRKQVKLLPRKIEEKGETLPRRGIRDSPKFTEGTVCREGGGLLVIEKKNSLRKAPQVGGEYYHRDFFRRSLRLLEEPPETATDDG